MISPVILRIMELLPHGIVVYLSKKILNYYINKCASIKVNGMENIKDEKQNVIFVCNHLSNSDGLVIERVLRDKDITFVAGIKLNDNVLTKLGIDMIKTISIKPNSADKNAMSKIINTVKEGNNILIFPEGTRSRNGKMLEGKSGVLLIAKMAKVPIVPIGIHGTEKLLPINDKDMAQEKFHEADIYVNIGKKFELPKKNKDEDRKQYRKRAMDYIMHKIAELVPEDYRGIYK